MSIFFVGIFINIRLDGIGEIRSGRGNGARFHATTRQDKEDDRKAFVKIQEQALVP